MWTRINRGRYFWLTGTTVLLLLASIASRSRVEHLTVQLANETKETGDLKTRVELLQSRVQQYSSLREVAPRAARDLGLHRADPGKIRVLYFPSPENQHTWVKEAYAGKTPGSDR